MTDLDFELFGLNIEIQNLESVIICTIVGIMAVVMMTSVGLKQVTDTYDKCVEKLPDKQMIEDKCLDERGKWVFSRILGIILAFPLSIYAVQFLSNRSNR